MSSPTLRHAPPENVAGQAALFLRLMARDAATVGMTKLIAIATLVILVLAVVLTQQQDTGLSELMDLSREDSFPESYMHGLAFFSAMVFFLCFLQYRTRLPLLLSFIYAFIWFDDSAQYHERAGLKFVLSLDLQPVLGLRAQDLGELMAWALVLPLVVALAIWAWTRRKPGDLGIAALVAASFAALVFFGLVVDMLHVALPEHLDYALGVVEDGGEMVAVAFTAILAVGMLRIGDDYRKICAAPAH